MNPRPKLILASASPRRLELLAQIGIKPHSVVPADIDEMPQRRERPDVYVKRMALEKAEAVSAGPSDVVLAADTTVAIGRRILGKPQDRSEAADFLKLMSGRRHTVLTAISVRASQVTRAKLVRTVVKMRPLDRRTLEWVLDQGDWQGKAGAYAIQGSAAALIPWIQGSYSAVVGLPLAETAVMLAAVGVEGEAK